MRELLNKLFKRGDVFHGHVIELRPKSTFVEIRHNGITKLVTLPKCNLSAGDKFTLTITKDER